MRSLETTAGGSPSIKGAARTSDRGALARPIAGAATPATGPGPEEQLLRLVTGYWVSAAIHAAAKLGLADRLARGPQTVAELARQTQTDDRSLYRLLRALASVGVFAEQDEGVFGMTPMAELLRRDRPESMWAFTVMAGDEHYEAYGHLLHSVRTGQPAFEKLHGQPVFPWLQKHPEQAAIFDAAMTGIHGRETEAMLQAYDFSGIGVLADVGGGNGGLLRAVLRQYPRLRGLLCDLPEVVDRARDPMGAAGLGERCRLAAVDFFSAVPAGADAYLLRHVLHDWEDERAVQILRNVRQACDARARVLVVETVIRPGNEPSFGKLLDLTMLVLPGGRERTQEEYRRLLAAAGFSLTQIVSTPVETSVIEGRPV